MMSLNCIYFSVMSPKSKHQTYDVRKNNNKFANDKILNNRNNELIYTKIELRNYFYVAIYFQLQSNKNW